jgi:hypothetical protein
MDGVDPYPIGFCRALHRDRLSEQADPSLRAAIPGQTCRSAEAATEDMMMMEPPPTRRIAGTAYFTDRNTSSRFTAVCRRQSANDMSTVLHKIPMRALATITSKRDKAAVQAWVSRCAAPKPRHRDSAAGFDPKRP